MSKDPRAISTILYELAKEQDLEYTPLSNGWIIRLRKNDFLRFIYGYEFDLNSSATLKILKNKHAVSEILRLNKIPTVEHYRFPLPKSNNDTFDEITWGKMLSFAQNHGFKFVCKPNEGSGGRAVVFVKSFEEFLKAVLMYSSEEHSICLSPYYEITREYRVITLNGNCELAYEKERPFIEGNGHSTLIDLISRQVNFGKVSHSLALTASELYQKRLHDVLPEKEKIYLTQKHNLSEGSRPVIVTDSNVKKELENIAVKSASALRANFASVDIIEVDRDLLVLEVNSGIVMESFIAQADNGYNIAKSIYKKAINLMFTA